MVKTCPFFLCLVNKLAKIHYSIVTYIDPKRTTYLITKVDRFGIKMIVVQNIIRNPI